MGCSFEDSFKGHIYNAHTFWNLHRLRFLARMLRVQFSFKHFMEVKALYFRIGPPGNLALLGLRVTPKIKGHLRTLLLLL
jgi:hypothetical protein